MNKISLYILLILLFLGLSKSFSPAEQKIPSVLNEYYFENVFSGSPISVVLVDSFQTGFLIKTFFQKYRVIHGFKPSEVMIVKTSQLFWEKNLKNLGMSLFRRGERETKASTVPMPPGALYVGDPAYGSFESDASGQEVWHFHRGYRHFPKLFEWGNWRPTKEFSRKLDIAIEQGVPFYGLNNEFGEKGSVTGRTFKNSVDKTPRAVTGFWRHMQKFWQVPRWSKQTTQNQNETELWTNFLTNSS